MRILRIRRAVKSDQGLSLAELLVGFFVSILLLTMVGGFFASVARGTQASAVADTNTRQMSTALSTMVQYLHAATTYPVSGQTLPDAAIVTANSIDVKFYAYVNLLSSDAQPVEVEYYVDPTTKHLKERQWASTCNATTGYCTFSSTVSKSFDLGGPVVSPVFTYYGSDIQTPLVITSTNHGSIQNVGINLEWGSTTAGSAGNGQARTTVGLLNLGQSGAQS
jgi:hypothetical protein